MLPKIRSIREAAVKVGNKSFKIKPWSNRDTLRYESALEDYDGTSENFKKELIYEHLIQPNLIDCDRDLTLIEREVVYIEMYKISKGTIIPLKYKCPIETCGQVTEMNFNISKNYKFHDMKEKEVKTDDVIFTLKSSNYVLREGDEPVKFYASFIREFDFKGEKCVADLEELTNWLLDELDDHNFEQFIEAMIVNLPYIEMTLECKCELCGNEETFHFKELPDF